LAAGYWLVADYWRQTPEARSQKPEARSQKPEARSQKPEANRIRISDKDHGPGSRRFSSEIDATYATRA
jgi:hypothetical protein